MSHERSVFDMEMGDLWGMWAFILVVASVLGFAIWMEIKEEKECKDQFSVNSFGVDVEVIRKEGFVLFVTNKGKRLWKSDL